MKKRKKRQYNKALLFAGMLLIIAIASFLLQKGYNSIGNFDQAKSVDQPSNKYAKYKALGFSIYIPPSFTVKDEGVGIELISQKGSINIIKNNTSFENLNDYILDFDNKRLVTSKSNIREIVVDNYKGLSRVVTFNNGQIQKSYYVYVDYQVFIFSTSSKELYDELDQIAQSFQYTPE